MSRTIQRRAWGHLSTVALKFFARSADWLLPSCYNALHEESGMIDIVLLWDIEDDPDGNVAHIADHGVTIEDVEEVFADPEAETEDSRNSTRSITFGETRDGRYFAVLWEMANEDPLMGYPITAYPVPRPRSRR